MQIVEIRNKVIHHSYQTKIETQIGFDNASYHVTSIVDDQFIYETKVLDKNM